MARYLLYSVWSAAVAASGCTGSHVPDLDAGPPSCPRESCDTPVPVDLLLVMEVHDFSSDFPPLVQRSIDALLAPLARNGAAASLHVGVVYGDMGTGMFMAPNCEMGGGFDGLLQPPNAAWPRCVPSSARYQVVASPDAVDDAAHAIGCSQFWYMDRCIPQSLEAMLKSLTPLRSDVEFRGVPGGHADVANVGFLRDDAVLAILFIGAHDDCSLSDLRHVEAGAPRCEDGRLCCEERLLPVDRYVDGLARLGSRRVLVNAITGIPVDARPTAGSSDQIREVLARPEMAMPRTPVCSGRFEDVFPSPRIVELAAACPGAVHSLCDPRVHDFASDGRAVMAEIGAFIAREACHSE